MIKTKKGFTLIELLVVIAIIGLVSTLAVVALNSSRIKAQNALKISTAGQYIKALEMYYDNSAEKEYPDLGVANNWRCLGVYSDSKCWNQVVNSPNPQIFYNSDPAISIGLEPYMALSEQKGQNMMTKCTNGTFEGFIYQCQLREDNRCVLAWLDWYVNGLDVKCGNQTFAVGGCTRCRWILTGK